VIKSGAGCFGARVVVHSLSEQIHIMGAQEQKVHLKKDNTFATLLYLGEEERRVSQREN
jgi:hypothetical protein